MSTDLIPVEILTGEIDYCHCGAMGSEGHTLSCIMEQMKRKKKKNFRSMSDDVGNRCSSKEEVNRIAKEVLVPIKKHKP